MGENNFAELPVAVYGVSMLMPAIAYFVLLWPLVRILSRLENRAIAGRR